MKKFSKKKTKGTKLNPEKKTNNNAKKEKEKENNMHYSGTKFPINIHDECLVEMF